MKQFLKDNSAILCQQLKSVLHWRLLLWLKQGCGADDMLHDGYHKDPAHLVDLIHDSAILGYQWLDCPKLYVQPLLIIFNCKTD